MTEVNTSIMPTSSPSMTEVSDLAVFESALWRRRVAAAMAHRYHEPQDPDRLDRDLWPAMLEEARRLWASRRLAWESLCPPAMLETDPSRLPLRGLVEIGAWQLGPTGLILHGETGSGKTRLAWLLLHRLFVWEFVNPVVFRVGELEEAMVQAYRAGRSDALLARLRRARVLFIDDFGKDKFTERLEAFLFTLINDRYEFKSPLLLTTNYVGDQLEARFQDAERGRPALRRLRECCHAVRVVPQLASPIPDPVLSNPSSSQQLSFST